MEDLLGSANGSARNFCTSIGSRKSRAWAAGVSLQGTTSNADGLPGAAVGESGWSGGNVGNGGEPEPLRLATRISGVILQDRETMAAPVWIPGLLVAKMQRPAFVLYCLLIWPQECQLQFDVEAAVSAPRM